MNLNIKKMIDRLRSAGLVSINETSLIENINQRSLYRYLKLINRYKMINSKKIVSQTKLLNLYSIDSKLRLRLQKIISLLEVKLKSEIHNSFFGAETVSINKMNTAWESNFLLEDSNLKDSYFKAKRGYHWKPGYLDMKTQDYIDGMMFGHMIATYYAIDSKTLSHDFRTLPSEQKTIVTSIRILRNSIAHHSFLYEFSKQSLTNNVMFMYEFLSFDKKEYKKIIGLIEELFKQSV